MFRKTKTTWPKPGATGLARVDEGHQIEHHMEEEKCR
jgi:hypothetical protein